MYITILATMTLGVLLGVLAGLLGTGGGTFAIPALVYSMGYGQKLAQGTALVMVVTNVFKGLLKYNDRSGLDLRISGILAVSGSISAAVSSMWAMSLSGTTLQRMYGIFLILLAAFVVFSKRKVASTDYISWQWAFIPGLIGGVSLGLFGVGGAMLAVPLLVMFFGQSQVRAQGLGLALALPGCSISLVQYACNAQVDWTTGAILAGGGLAGVSYGVTIAHSIKEKTLTNLFCLFLVFGGVLMLTK